MARRRGDHHHYIDVGIQHRLWVADQVRGWPPIVQALPDLGSPDADRAFARQPARYQPVELLQIRPKDAAATDEAHTDRLTLRLRHHAAGRPSELTVITPSVSFVLKAAPTDIHLRVPCRMVAIEQWPQCREDTGHVDENCTQSRVLRRRTGGLPGGASRPSAVSPGSSCLMT